VSIRKAAALAAARILSRSAQEDASKPLRQLVRTSHPRHRMCFPLLPETSNASGLNVKSGASQHLDSLQPPWGFANTLSGG
jgi:hypothetical protein